MKALLDVRVWGGGEGMDQGGGVWPLMTEKKSGRNQEERWVNSNNNNNSSRVLHANLLLSALCKET